MRIRRNSCFGLPRHLKRIRQGSPTGLTICLELWWARRRWLLRARAHHDTTTRNSAFNRLNNRRRSAWISGFFPAWIGIIEVERPGHATMVLERIGSDAAEGPDAGHRRQSKINIMTTRATNPKVDWYF